MSTRRAGSSAAWTRRACTSTPRRGSPTAASSGWVRRSGTRRRSCTRAGRSGCVSCARSSTSSRATATCARSAAVVARIGILGGTFNPPHVGHLVCAQEALVQLGLDRVLLMPVHTPPHKELSGDPGPQARLALCRAAVGDDPRFEVCDLEQRRGGPSFTVDTL